MHLEQSFGMLISRWGVLWRPLKFSVRRNIRAVHLCMVLHNFGISNSDNYPETLMSAEYYTKIREYSKALCDRASGLPGRTVGSTNSVQRCLLVQKVKELSLSRPNTQQTNVNSSLNDPLTAHV